MRVPIQAIVCGMVVLVVASAPAAGRGGGGWHGQIDLNVLVDSDQGAILYGCGAHDLAGSTLTWVPDLDGDGDDELLISARFGKPVVINPQGVGFGEAYLIYGGGGFNDAEHPHVRIHGMRALQEVGQITLPGLVFAGIRMPMNTTWTHGLADVACVPDMDGDGRPEIVFGFPRAESLNLKAPAVVHGVPYQHPDLVADLPGMGNLEYDAIDHQTGQWTAHAAQFTRGGAVIVSSQNAMLRDAAQLDRRGGRVLDLHEAGQLFNTMALPELTKYVRKVELDQSQVTWWVVWDTVFRDEGPGGFHMPWTDVSANPPLANPISFAPTPRTAQDDLPGYPNCVVRHRWYAWIEESDCTQPLPGTDLFCVGAWAADWELATCAWTGFYGPATTPTIDVHGQPWPAPVGARMLGQATDDRLGDAVDADESWLYVAAPERTARREDIPALPADRPGAGVVYMYRVNTPAALGQPTRSQLWIEPDQIWPHPDKQIPDRVDYTMPVPHQYILKAVGSIRGNPGQQEFAIPAGPCTPEYDSGLVAPADEVLSYGPYPPGTAGYYIGHVSQIVGPHEDARIAFVRALGDVNGDGLGDFAVGSLDVRDADANGAFTGPVVGSVFVVYGRPPGVGGDFLLEHLALSPWNPDRIGGVLLQGASPAEPIGRAFDRAGDFNGDGMADFIVGDEFGAGGCGDAVIVLGSRFLESPAGGWTVSEIVAAGYALRFRGASFGDRAGANVCAAGDVDHDGFDDVLIAAPDAANGRGKVYLVYGSPSLSGELNLADIETGALPGAVFIGRHPNDHLGGGEKVVFGTDPGGGSTRCTARGIASLGDLDADGYGDFAISSMLASPEREVEAGEVYILYGGPRRILGDMNCDGAINAFDIDPFVLALTNPDEYAATYPNCNINNADINCDGAMNAFDIDPFVQCLTVGCPPCR